MFKDTPTFSGFSVSDLAVAKTFYNETLGLELVDETMGLKFRVGGGGTIYVYPKDDHQPASFTILNFVVEDIDKAVEELKAKGVKFEKYEGMTDDKDIARGIAAHRGPDIAWFKDPAGNILAVLHEG